MSNTGEASPEFDYIVVGGGAGGGVVASRLAHGGQRVLLLEAGCDPLEDAPGQGDSPRRLDTDYRVPAFHPFASEHPAMRWDFWVRHYADPGRQARDPKYRQGQAGHPDGVLYPRCAALGGCTAHNAMIFVLPHNADWNHIAEITGDASWRASHMRRYLRRMERCRHRAPAYRLLARLGIDPTGHGWSGWLSTEVALPLRALRDWRLRRTLLRSARAAFKALREPGDRMGWLLRGQGDPNDARLVDENAFGVRYLPLSTRRHARTGARELVLATRRAHPDRLTVRTGAFVTRLLFDPADPARIAGVEYAPGGHLNRADPACRNEQDRREAAFAGREVVLAGGVFNTPQLLMLSGIGPAAELARHAIPVRHEASGVGRRLQDRYEVGVVNRMRRPWPAMKGARFDRRDRYFRKWRLFRSGVYSTNGSMLSLFRRSSPGRVLPDLCCFSLLADFHGYYPGYAQDVRKLDYLTWAILKGHTTNKAGWVRLRSADPFDTPEINFAYFEEAGDGHESDLHAVVEGIRFVRRITDALGGLVDEEEIPGRHLYSDADLEGFVKANAWGHHACGTCAMMPRGDGGVVDSRFKVYGLDNLRIVDASVFPEIPGFFIVSSVYMIAEKAADEILGAGGRG